MSLTEIMTILWRRSWIVGLTFLTALALAIVVIKVVPSRFDAEATATMDPNGVDPVTAVTNGDSNVINLIHGNMIALVTSARVAHEVVNRLNLTSGAQNQADYRNSKSFGKQSLDDFLASSLIKNVTPKFIFGTNVLSITYKTNDPEIAAQVANAFLVATVDATIAMKAASAEQTARWFDPELEDLRDQLNKARTELTKFQAESNMVAPGGAGDSEGSQLIGLTQDLTNAKNALSVLNSDLATPDPTLWADATDPNVQMLATLRNRLTLSHASTDAMTPFLSANNPKAILEAASQNSVQKQIDELKNAIELHLKTRIEATNQQIATLQGAHDAAQKALIEVQVKRDHMADLQARVAFRQEQFDTRQKVAEQARLQSKMTFSNIVFLDRALPPISAAFPKPSIVLAVGLSGGLALGLILALIAEALDRRIRALGDLEVATSTPTLGAVRKRRFATLPRVGFGVTLSSLTHKESGASKSASPSSHLVMKSDPMGLAAEDFRSIQSTLTASASEKGHRAFVVVGPQARSRSGYFAANLALAFAETRVSTLLIDANLRNPALADLFNIDRAEKGFADAVLEWRAGDVPFLKNVAPNLSLMSAGAKTASPHEVLSLANFENLIEQAQKDYDIVIYDTSDALTTSDAYVVASRTRGSVIVRARQHQTKFRDISKISKTLDRFRCASIGAILEKA